MLMVPRNSKNGSVTPATYLIEIKDDNTDLEVTIEGSDHLYGSKLVMASVDKDTDAGSGDGNDRGMGKLLGHIFGSKNILSADSISSPKHMTKYLFRGIPSWRCVSESQE